MLGRRPIAISLLLLSAMPFVRVGAIDGLDVLWHTAPKVDGVIGDGEYPAPTSVSNCRLYLSQNTSFLFIAVSIPDTTSSADDGVTIWIGSEPPSPERMPRMDDYAIIVSRGGAFTAPGLNKIKNATTTDSGGWRTEVAIGFSELDVTAGQQDKSLGFALFIRDGGQESVRWPANADKDSPKTWGMLSSSYSWGTVDLAAQSLTLGTQKPIMGENVTIYYAYTNRGSSPISGPQIGFYVDGALLALIEDARVIKTESYVVSAVWRATAGNHTIMAKLDPQNNIHETNEDNNEYSVNVYVKPASLKIRAQEGANVTVDGVVSMVGPSKEITQEVNLGVHTFVAQETLYYGDVRYVFNKWKWGSEESNDSTIAISITGDMSLEASYRTEYMVRLRFLDGKGNNITELSEVRFTAPNGSSKVLNGTYELWLQQGAITITNIIWSSVDVRPADTTYQIQGPRTLAIRCNVFDVTVQLSDSLSLPVSGANVTLVLPNTTRAWLLTDADGEAHFAQIPAGSLSGTVSNLGFITPIPEQDLTSDSTIRLSLVLSASTIVLIGSILTVMLLALLFFLRKKGPKRVKGKPDKLLRSLGPPT